MSRINRIAAVMVALAMVVVACSRQVPRASADAGTLGSTIGDIATSATTTTVTPTTTTTTTAPEPVTTSTSSSTTTTIPVPVCNDFTRQEPGRPAVWGPDEGPLPIGILVDEPDLWLNGSTYMYVSGEFLGCELEEIELRGEPEEMVVGLFGFGMDSNDEPIVGRALLGWLEKEAVVLYNAGHPHLWFDEDAPTLSSKFSYLPESKGVDLVMRLRIGETYAMTISVVPTEDPSFPDDCEQRSACVLVKYLGVHLIPNNAELVNAMRGGGDPPRELVWPSIVFATSS